ncbi:MAG TPA: hypothetical protein PKL56_18310 [Cyclobacteriaceae bacterium]|nr:hypothetical protein [Cyclobacteriaceae bacterium]HMX00932.1 hypothetical protein [Cyclobacteriaceae bacterium]HMX50025.1 hypothetical protein [Cyclobacteriaceae bacterium]HMY93736.1 hypothetical protein [Cyclobacteriaceae bacterium]HNA12609.1 hypothetical protein [Cyclobacteriaceae bacterium]
MNGAEINQNHGGGSNWIAFVFGAVFNLLGNVNLMFLLDYALQAVVGGIICLAFKVLGDVLSPLWEKHKERVKDFTKMRKIRGFKIRKKKRHDQE